MAVTVFAPAKINLSLHVGRPHADGRHPLTSIVAFADVGDVLTMEEGPAELILEGPFAAALEGENLITRALARLGVSARVRLQKNLPVASGIGGGSADAAAALRGANALAGGKFNDDHMMEIAAALGADIPVCLACKPAWMSGGGETVTPAEMPDLHGILVNPGVALSTGDVYRRFDEMEGGKDIASDAPPSWRDTSAALAGLASLRNDLAEPAYALAPGVRDVLAALSAQPVRLARMSGSGATCFGLVASLTEAETVARAITSAAPNWWVRPVRLGAVDAAPRAI